MDNKSKARVYLVDFQIFVMMAFTAGFHPVADIPDLGIGRDPGLAR